MERAHQNGGGDTSLILALEGTTFLCWFNETSREINPLSPSLALPRLPLPARGNRDPPTTGPRIHTRTLDPFPPLPPRMASSVPSPTSASLQSSLRPQPFLKLTKTFFVTMTTYSGSSTTTHPYSTVSTLLTPTSSARASSTSPTNTTPSRW